MDSFLEAYKSGASMIAIMSSLAFSSAPPAPIIPTAAEVTKLQAQVKNGDSQSILPYVRAHVIADHPEVLGQNGQPKFIIGFMGDPDYSDLAIAKVAYAQLGNTEIIGRLWNAALTGTNIIEYQKQTVGRPFSHDQTVGGNAYTINSGTPHSITSIALNGHGCSACRSHNSQIAKTCDITTPAGLRLFHVMTTANAEHEIGHLLSQQLGLYEKRGQKTGLNEPNVREIAEENYAHTYEALRVIQIFGAEGSAYIEWSLRDRVNAAKNGGDVSHWAVASFRNVLDYYQKNPDLVTRPSKSMAMLAEQLSAPPTLEQLNELKKKLSSPDRAAPDVLSKNFNALTSSKKASELTSLLQTNDVQRHARLYDLYALGSKDEHQEYLKMTAELNPVRPATFTVEQSLSTRGPFTQEQIIDLEALNKQNRAPSCESVASVLRDDTIYTKKQPKIAPTN